MSAKKVTDSQLLGEMGVTLISRLVLNMGYVFRPTGTLDAGIDGEIEIRNVLTGEVTNQIIKVQSKAVAQFQGETDAGFDYWPRDEDVKYWLGGNVPVILVVSRPATGEAYWVSVQRYKAEAKAKKIHFDKSRDRLDNTAAAKLASLVKDVRTGIYSPPAIKHEQLLSNLLPVTRLPDRLWVASTDYRDRQTLVGAMGEEAKNIGREWILKSKQILSFRDLREHPFRDICDLGTAEDFPIGEWANSLDVERQRDFVALLNATLRQKVYPLGMRFEPRPPMLCYYARGNRELKPVRLGYSGGKKLTNRDVFHVYRTKTGDVSYCRHSAFKGQFYRFDGKWYLEVTPTYYFTTDGLEHYAGYEPLLKGIKRLEKNSAVRGQVIMWAELLAQDEDMYRTSYPYLGIGAPVAFEIEVGLDDEQWLVREETNATLASGQTSLAFEAAQ